MPDGTTLNGIEAYRIHRSNARDTIEDSEAHIASARQTLIAMSVFLPNTELDEIIERVNDTVDWIIDSAIQSRFAQHLVDYPEECVDDYDKEAVK